MLTRYNHKIVTFTMGCVIAILISINILLIHNNKKKIDRIIHDQHNIIYTIDSYIITYDNVNDMLLAFNTMQRTIEYNQHELKTLMSDIKNCDPCLSQ
jgi:hypothetical protein